MSSPLKFWKLFLLWVSKHTEPQTEIDGQSHTAPWFRRFCMNCSLYNNTNTTSTPNATAATTTQCKTKHVRRTASPVTLLGGSNPHTISHAHNVGSWCEWSDYTGCTDCTSCSLWGGGCFFLQSNLDGVVPNLLISIPETLLGIHVEFLVMARKDLQPLLLIRLWRPFCSFNCVV